MSPDQLTTWVMAAAMVGGCVGFFACALFAAKMLRDTYEEAYESGYKHGLSDAGEAVAEDDLDEIRWQAYPPKPEPVEAAT